MQINIILVLFIINSIIKSHYKSKKAFYIFIFLYKTNKIAINKNSIGFSFIKREIY